MTTEQELPRELAVIKQIFYGYTDKGIGAMLDLQLLSDTKVLFLDDVVVSDLLTRYKIGNIMLLQGQPCAVYVKEDGDVVFDNLL